MSHYNTVRSVIYGGALGDAAGWPFEFENEHHIRDSIESYGIEGGIGDYTDDTQMTIACCSAVSLMGTEWDEHAAYLAYQYWSDTQNIPEQNRAPGLTVMRSLRDGIPGSISRRINDSRGNGGVMRAAPYGLVPGISREAAFRNAMLDSALTHSNWGGFIPSAIQAAMVWMGANTLMPPRQALDDVLDNFYTMFNSVEERGVTEQERQSVVEFMDALTLFLLGRETNVLDAMWYARAQGYGTGNATLMVALAALLTFETFEEGVRFCITTDGDSDTYAAVFGNLWGAFFGSDGFPESWMNRLNERSALDEAINLVLNIQEV